MLSEAKHLHPLNANRILRCAQDDVQSRRRFWDRFHADRDEDSAA